MNYLTPCPNCNWPHHVPEGLAITLVCAKCGTKVHCNGGGRVVGGKHQRPTKQRLTPEQRAEKKAKAEKRKAKQSRLIRWLAKFRTTEDTGAGDTVERLLAYAGGRKLKWLLAVAKLPCGCTNRQRWLNEKHPW